MVAIWSGFFNKGKKMTEYIVERDNQGVKQEIKRFSYKEDAVEFALEQSDEKINIYECRLITTMEINHED